MIFLFFLYLICELKKKLFSDSSAFFFSFLLEIIFNQILHKRNQIQSAALIPCHWHKLYILYTLLIHLKWHWYWMIDVAVEFYSSASLVYRLEDIASKIFGILDTTHFLFSPCQTTWSLWSERDKHHYMSASNQSLIMTHQNPAWVHR